MLICGVRDAVGGEIERLSGGLTRGRSGSADLYSGVSRSRGGGSEASGGWVLLLRSTVAAATSAASCSMVLSEPASFSVREIAYDCALDVDGERGVVGWPGEVRSSGAGGHVVSSEWREAA